MWLIVIIITHSHICHSWSYLWLIIKIVTDSHNSESQFWYKIFQRSHRSFCSVSSPFSTSYRSSMINSASFYDSSSDSSDEEENDKLYISDDAKMDFTFIQEIVKKIIKNIFFIKFCVDLFAWFKKKIKNLFKIKTLV